MCVSLKINNNKKLYSLQQHCGIGFFVKLLPYICHVEVVLIRIVYALSINMHTSCAAKSYTHTHTLVILKITLLVYFAPLIELSELKTLARGLTYYLFIY